MLDHRDIKSNYEWGDILHAAGMNAMASMEEYDYVVDYPGTAIDDLYTLIGSPTKVSTLVRVYIRGRRTVTLNVDTFSSISSNCVWIAGPTTLLLTATSTTNTTPLYSYCMTTMRTPGLDAKFDLYTMGDFDRLQFGNNNTKYGAYSGWSRNYDDMAPKYGSIVPLTTGESATLSLKDYRYLTMVFYGTGSIPNPYISLSEMTDGVYMISMVTCQPREYANYLKATIRHTDSQWVFPVSSGGNKVCNGTITFTRDMQNIPDLATIRSEFSYAYQQPYSETSDPKVYTNGDNGCTITAKYNPTPTTEPLSEYVLVPNDVSFSLLSDSAPKDVIIELDSTREFTIMSSSSKEYTTMLSTNTLKLKLKPVRSERGSSNIYRGSLTLIKEQGKLYLSYYRQGGDLQEVSE